MKGLFGILRNVGDVERIFTFGLPVKKIGFNVHLVTKNLEFTTMFGRRFGSGWKEERLSGQIRLVTL